MSEWPCTSGQHKHCAHCNLCEHKKNKLQLTDRGNHICRLCVKFMTPSNTEQMRHALEQAEKALDEAARTLRYAARAVHNQEQCWVSFEACILADCCEAREAGAASAAALAAVRAALGERP